ncbi:hypothetical protein [Luteibacter sp.]|uniref:hypothetical protein n=1 Tax=Luteibacter sp. TaxID=1886636 RepID=UPI0025B7BB9E|nr:hypothetical protein [Luteibacter sp.]
MARFDRAPTFIARFHIAAAQDYGGKRRVMAMTTKSLASAMALMAHIRLCERYHQDTTRKMSECVLHDQRNVIHETRTGIHSSW